MRTIPIDMLKQIFSYNPLTGDVYWVIPRRNVKAGSVAGNIDPSSGYIRVTFAQKTLKTHRIGWALSYGVWPTLDIDHINGCKSDNRLINLRLATRTENIRNAKKKKTAQCSLKGITPYKDNVSKFIAQININGKQQYLGLYATEQEAHDKYCEVAKKEFGEFFKPDCLCHQSGQTVVSGVNISLN